MARPLFSVVMATFGRGRHILPSVQSVLQQPFQDFELIVVGDHCTDETELVLTPLAGDRLRWINLPERWHGQSGPNNAGVAAARGRYIAYIGHDDIWGRDHLENLARVFEGPEAPDFAIAGAILHMPPGVDRPRVTGLFEAPSDASKYFFPPSSVSHRFEAFAKVGPWSRALDIRPPVDVDFQRRALAAGLKYASTGKVSVHKFAAAMRYLSYLRHSSDEQEAMLLAMDQTGFGLWVDQQVELSKKQGGFMNLNFGTHDHLEPGQVARKNMAHKGVVLPPLIPLVGGVSFPQEEGGFGHDWADRPEGQIRWAGFNPNPKWLLNVTDAGEAQVLCSVAHDAGTSLNEIKIEGPGVRDTQTGPTVCVSAELAFTPVRFKVQLSISDYTVITFRLTPEQTRSQKRRGIGLTTVYVLPAHVSRSVLDDIGQLAKLIAETEGQRLLLSGIGAAYDEVAELRKAYYKAVKRIHAIETSTSWRSTSVFREVVGRLRRLPVMRRKN